MLNGTNEARATPAAATVPSGLSVMGEGPRAEAASQAANARSARKLGLEWFGQTAASLCWIASVFAYGISSAGDWLQLGAASAWLLANVAAAMASETD